MNQLREWFPRRILFAYLVGAVASIPFMILASELNLEGWLAIFCVAPGMLLGTLVDREGFYGPRDGASSPD